MYTLKNFEERLVFVLANLNCIENEMQILRGGYKLNKCLKFKYRVIIFLNLGFNNYRVKVEQVIFEHVKALKDLILAF